jgi:two-component system cell cycle response regulator
MVSVGVAALSPDIQDGPVLLKAADEALYRAKREGRNRVIAAAERAPA